MILWTQFLFGMQGQVPCGLAVVKRAPLKGLVEFRLKAGLRTLLLHS